MHATAPHPTVRGLLGEGLSRRAIGRVMKVSDQTVRADLELAEQQERDGAADVEVILDVCAPSFPISSRSAEFFAFEVNRHSFLRYGWSRGIGRVGEDRLG